MNYRRAFWAGLHVTALGSVLVGAVLCWFFPLLTFVQVVGVTWLVWFHLTRGYCPLTKKEHEAMKAAGQKPYKGGFYEYYLFKKILKMDVDGAFVRHFLTLTKILPGYLPLVYPAVRHLA